MREGICVNELFSLAFHFPYLQRLLDNLDLELYEFILLIIVLSVGYWLARQIQEEQEPS